MKHLSEVATVQASTAPDTKASADPSRPWRSRFASGLRVCGKVAVCALVLTLALEFGLRLYYRMPIAERYYRERPGPVAYGLAPSQHYRYRYNGRTLTVSTDASGNRLTPGAPAGGGRALYLIGDSQVFGWGLSDNETIAAALERQLGTGWRVVNLGVPGYGPYAYADVLAHLPDSSLAIVLQTEANDFQDAYFARSPFRSRCGYLVSRSFLGENAPCFVLSSYVLVKAIDWFIKPRAKLPPALGYNPYAAIAARVLRYRIENLYRTALDRKAHRVLFGAIPWDAAVSPKRLSNYQPVLNSPQELTELPDACGLDALFKSSAEPDRLFQENDSHLSARGAEVVAGQLARLVPQLSGGTTSEEWPPLQ